MLLTEEKLRTIYKKNEKMKEIVLEKKTILTPSAKQFLIDKDIKIVEKLDEKKQETLEEIAEEKKPKYKGVSGEIYYEKPEYMTQLYGNILVKKNHKRVIFRGVVDSFISRWLVMTKDLENIKNTKLQRDLESVEKFINKILISEVVGEAIGDVMVLDKTLDEIRELSHNPKKYFDRGHLFGISSKDSYLVIKLNEMRTLSREVEIKGVEAFVDESGKVERRDLLLSLNRLSSVIYVMMLKGVTGEYGYK